MRKNHPVTDEVRGGPDTGDTPWSIRSPLGIDDLNPARPALSRVRSEGLGYPTGVVAAPWTGSPSIKEFPDQRGTVAEASPDPGPCRVIIRQDVGPGVGSFRQPGVSPCLFPEEANLSAF
ncbi:MAG: hypothetical protein NVSMB9_26720 [Isosphaeraceae bacterium]